MYYSYDSINAADEILKRITEMMNELKTINLMVLGKTGVGKSTLINALFGKERVKTGTGRPITNQIERISADHLTIYDTPGLELSGDNSLSSLLDQVVGVINGQIDNGTIDDAIHCILYCVSVTSHRFEDQEAEFIKKLQNKIKTHDIPIFIVLTQAFNKGDSADLKNHIASLNLKIEAIVPVLATDYYVDEDYTAKKRGVSELADMISNVMPESVQKTFDTIQCANLSIKQKRAQAIIFPAAAVAAGIGASPIPFSDAALLVPSQIGMLAGITAVFGLPIEKTTFTAILSATIGTGGATLLGKTIVANLVKLVPGAGSIIGGFISGGTAAALTAALGEAYTGIMVYIFKNGLSPSFLKTKEAANMLQTMYKSRLGVKRDKNGEPIDKDDNL